MRKIITLFSVICTLASINAQQRCSFSLEGTFNENPDALEEFNEFNEFTNGFSVNEQMKSSSSGNIIMPVVVHVYGRTQNGETVTDEKIMNSIEMVNEDFQGLNPDFYTVDPLFVSIRSKTNIIFKLAQIDPDGNPTTGIIDHTASAGQGNYNNAAVTADAWDNYKYMNLYLTADLHDNGSSTNSGIAWLPNTADSDANKARVTYNGRYLKGNTDDEFASILSHEFGHWLNLAHTFEGGCESPYQDYVDDTPQEDFNPIDDGCVVGATDCGDSLINYENYMGYDSVSGCAKMFTRGQTNRMYAALHHAARFPLWQNDNLIATGVGASFNITPRIHNGSWEDGNALQVCPGTNVKLGMQDIGTNFVSVIKPNGLVDNTPDGATYWNFDNVQEEDGGTYLIAYDDGNGNVGFSPITLTVGYSLTPWVETPADGWHRSSTVTVCPGTDIHIGTQNLGTSNAVILLPNGTTDNTPDLGTGWKFTNVQAADAGKYTITYDFGICTASVEIELIIGAEVKPWIKQGSSWYNQAYVEACVGEGVSIGMQTVGTENVTLMAPDGSIDATPDYATAFDLTNLQASDFGMYTITWSDPAGCSGTTNVELVYKSEAMDGWVKDNAGTWTKTKELYACVGDNISLGTTNNGLENFTMTYPNGTTDTTPDIGTGWDFNNIQEADEGIYKIEYDNQGCYGMVEILLTVGVTDLTDKIEYQLNNQDFVVSTTNSIVVDEGDKITLKLPNELFDGSISWSGPNGFQSNYNAIDITDSAIESDHAGTYTATVNHNNCGGGTAIIDFEIAFASAAAPIANFSQSAATICPNEIVVFTDLSTNTPSSWAWSFLPDTVTYQNGTDAISQNPEISFDAGGTYQVTLTATNAVGSNEITQPVNALVSVVTPLLETFETAIPPSSWQIINPDDLKTWEASTVTGSDGNLTEVIYMNNFAYNANGQLDELTMPSVDISTMSNPILQFDLAYTAYNAGNFERLHIEYSTDCGQNFTATSYDKQDLTLATIADYQTSSWTPASAADWRTETVDLSSYQSSSTIFKFIQTNGYGNNLFIDNVRIIDNVATVDAIVLLQGASLNPNAGEETLMRDDLRVTGGIPTTSPYADGRSVSVSVFGVTGNDAIVDWVWLELRDVGDSTVVLDSRSALLQRDGNVVDLDGVSTVEFAIAHGNYHVVVKHKNHLGIMTSNTVALSRLSTVVDFTNAASGITYGTDAQTSFGMPNGKLGMWGGDANADGRLNYSGALSDVPLIRNQVFNDPDNSVFGGPPVASYHSLGYHGTDVNMDNVTIYSGAASDVLNIRNNIFNNPSNSVFGGPPTSTYVFIQQLPEGGN